MKNMTRVLALLMVLALVTVSLCGCWVNTTYTGPYPELCSVAWANLGMVYGYVPAGEIVYEPDLEVLETDSYGRVLFSYSEKEYYDSDTEGLYLLIMQAKTDNEALYYPEDCYRFIVTEVNAEPIYDTETIMQLKELNDWERPLDESRCDSTPIVNKKPEGKIKNGKSDAFLEGVTERYYERVGRYVNPRNISFVRTSRFVVSDDYGRELYFVFARLTDYEDKREIYYSHTLAIVMMPDGTCDESTVILLENPYASQSDIKLIKQMNSWNQPIE